MEIVPHCLFSGQQKCGHVPLLLFHKVGGFRMEKVPHCLFSGFINNFVRRRGWMAPPTPPRLPPLPRPPPPPCQWAGRRPRPPSPRCTPPLHPTSRAARSLSLRSPALCRTTSPSTHQYTANFLYTTYCTLTIIY
jgi:hypothetical protein